MCLLFAPDAHAEQLLFTGGLDVSCYDLEQGRILVTLQHGWEAFKLKDFLVDQVDVAEVEWNQAKYPGKHLPRKKASKTKKSKKAKKPTKSKQRSGKPTTKNSPSTKANEL